MVLLGSILNLLFAVISLASDELIDQTHVPVLMWSYHLSPELHKYMDDSDNLSPVPLTTLLQAVGKHIGDCEFSAFIFINQPGLRKDDFIEYEEEFVNLEKQLGGSSTAVSFEQVELLPQDTFTQLTEYVQEQCKIDKVLYVEGDNVDSFQTYIDIEKRIIRIEYPPLPEDPEYRRNAIFTFDSNLRKILAQVPSPDYKVIYTSLDPDTDVLESKGTIFPHIFQDEDRKDPIERNKRQLNPPPPFNAYKPKWAGMTGEYLSIFDAEFIQENRQLLLAITSSLFGYLILQFIFPSYATASEGNTKSKKSAKDVTVTDKKSKESPKVSKD